MCTERFDSNILRRDFYMSHPTLMTMKNSLVVLPRAIVFALALVLASHSSVAIAAEKAAATAPTKLASRDFKVDHRYLNIPIKGGAPKQKVALLVDGVSVVVNDMELAASDP